MKLLYNIFHIQNSKSKCYGSDRISLMKTWLLNNINCKKKCIKEVPSNREKVWHFLCHILWHQSRFNRISYWLSLLTLNKGGYTRDQKFWQLLKIKSGISRSTYIKQKLFLRILFGFFIFLCIQ